MRKHSSAKRIVLQAGMEGKDYLAEKDVLITCTMEEFALGMEQ